MKQRQKSRKTSSRLANDPCPIVSAYLHTKQPATSGKSYLQFPDKVIHTTYESQHEKGLAEGQSLECRSNSRPKQTSCANSQNRIVLDKKRSCQQLSEYLAGTNKKLVLHSQHSHSAIPSQPYEQRKLSKKKPKARTPLKSTKKKSTMTLRKESRLAQPPATTTSNRLEVNSSKLLRSVRDFSLLTHSHRSIERTVKADQPTASKMHIEDDIDKQQDMQDQPYLHRDALISMYQRTSDLLQTYSSKYKHLLKINQQLSKELAIIKRNSKQPANSPPP